VLKADVRFSRKNGCKEVPELPKRWPLGLDRIKQIWQANASGRLLEFFCDIARDYEPGNIVSQYFMFGPRCYNILIPSDVEAVLSTNFTGVYECREITATDFSSQSTRSE
jgi:hypothetical protein